MASILLSELAKESLAFFLTGHKRPEVIGEETWAALLSAKQSAVPLELAAILTQIDPAVTGILKVNTSL